MTIGIDTEPFREDTGVSSMASLLGAILVIAWVVLSKFTFDFIFYNRVKVEQEIFAKKNRSLALSYAGFLTALSFTLYMTFVYESFIRELFNLFFLTSFMFLGVYVFDLLFLRKIDLKEEILKNNLSAGTVQGFYFVAIGLIISGAYWRKENLILSVFYSSIYLFLGMVFLYISTLLISRVLSLDFQEEVKKNNLSASLVLGSLTVAVSLVIFNSISGEFLGNIFLDIFTTLFYFLISQILMVILYLLFEYVIFRKVLLSAEIIENNLSASLTLGAVFLTSAFITMVLIG